MLIAQLAIGDTAVRLCHMWSYLDYRQRLMMRTSNARFPPFRCRSSVPVSPFCCRKIPLFCKNYVRKFRSVTAVSGKKIRNGNGNGVQKRQRLTGTAKRQRKNGNGMMETGHNIWRVVTDGSQFKRLTKAYKPKGLKHAAAKTFVRPATFLD